MKLIHRTMEGKEMLLSDMEDSHLINTIKMQIRKSEEGITLRSGCEGYYEEEHLEGEEVLKYFHHKEYLKEAKKRGLIKHTSFQDYLLSELGKQVEMTNGSKIKIAGSNGKVKVRGWLSVDEIVFDSIKDDYWG